MYEKSKEKELSPELFANPDSEFRGAPFWAWNQKLDKETLERHMGYFGEMGMGGFHMHTRTGLDTPYMEEEYLDCVKACVDRAQADGMYAFLYDEDRWPSGSAGGKVTKDAAFRSRYLIFTPVSNEERKTVQQEHTSTSRAEVRGDGKLLARYDIVLKDGFLDSYRRLAGEEQGDNVWYLYEEVAGDNPWYNNQAYVDTLNPDAIRRFIEETHEKYLACVGDRFGKTVPSIFTDEPQFSHKTCLGFAQSREDVVLPYTDRLPEGYKKTYGADFFDTLPELVWELPGGAVSQARYRYHDYVAELFSSSFADTIGSWCREHGLMLTGHMMEEPTLASQTNALGEAMRSYRSFQLPGIDMLCDWREYTTAKQAQSASHQYGCPGVLSEIYGVTNWDFDFRRHKLAGDWQAALGVTLRVHHLSWDSMNGEAKRDYPASIFYQSPWYKEYGMIEDHFARVNTALTRGKALVRIGVIHPVESYWLHYGPKEQTAMIREELEQHFQDVTRWLLFSQLDFDFIAESLLPSQYTPSDDRKLHVGQMAYDVILVPGCETLRESTVSRLEEFADKGGDVLFMGQAPRLMDALPSERAAQLYSRSRQVGFSESSLVAALAPYREVELRLEDGSLVNSLLCQLREDGDSRWLFAANGKREENPDVPVARTVTFRLGGLWKVTEYDTMTGTIRPVDVQYENGKTVFTRQMFNQTSVLVKLEPTEEENTGTQVAEKQKDAKPDAAGSVSVSRAALIKEEGEHLPEPFAFRLSEPNVLLLDLAEWKLDEGEWQEREEILRLDNTCRQILGWPARMEAFAQPWTGKKETPIHRLTLRFSIRSRVPVTDGQVALEETKHTRIRLNGQAVEKRDAGYFVDECIRRIPLPVIPAGESVLELEIAYGPQVNVEWCYLLGSFGVQLAGSRAELVPMPDHLTYGDYSAQGLPFYAGNVSYDITLEAKEAGEYVLAAEKFRAPLLKAELDGRTVGRIALAPYQLDLGWLEKGSHTLTLTSFGNRCNAFGAVHNCNEKTTWFGPNAWRTQGAEYSYEYQLIRMGILTAPRLFRIF